MKPWTPMLLLALWVPALPCRAADAPATVEAPPAAASTPPASTADVEHCVRQHERARMLRLDEQWPEAREAMSRCADEACPVAIRTDCSDWLDELSQMIPTLLVVVERDDDGKHPVRLELDGRVLDLPEQLGPIEVMPGRHRLKFMLVSYPSVEQEIVLEKGEKNRVVRVRFAREPKPLPAPAAAPARAPPRASRPIPVATYLLAGGAVAAFASSGWLLTSTLSSLSAARANCAPTCKSSDREDIEARLLVADAIAGAGVVLTGLAVYTFVKRPVILETGASLAPKIGVGRGRADLFIQGRF